VDPYANRRGPENGRTINTAGGQTAYVPSGTVYARGRDLRERATITRNVHDRWRPRRTCVNIIIIQAIDDESALKLADVGVHNTQLRRTLNDVCVCVCVYA